MNYYRKSNGHKVSKSTIDYRIRKAKSDKLEEFYEEHKYYFCEDCKKNDCVPIDCSHDLSVDQCQKQGMSEKAWDVDNITLRGRPCHVKHDAKSRIE